MSKSLLQRWFGRTDTVQAQADAQAHKSAGDALLEQGDPAAAEARYRAAIATAPRFAPAHTNLAFALRAQQRARDAAHSVHQALALDATQPDAHYLAAALARDDGHMESAERHFRLALELAPGMGIARQELCELLARQERFEEAIDLINDGLALEPDHAGLFFYLGNLRHGLRQYEAAVTAYRAALSHGLASAGLLNNLGLALIEQHDETGFRDAAEVFGQLVALVPDSAEAHNHLGHALALGGDIDGAVTHFERALAIDPCLVSAHFNLGNALLAQDDARAALVQYRLLIADRPDLAAVHFQMGVALEKLERFAEADQCFRATLALAPDHVEALQRHGCMLQNEERFEEALASHRQALAQQPDNVEAHYNSGVALHRMAEAYEQPYREQKIDEAVAAYRAALALDPAHLRSLHNLASIMKERREFAQAVDTFQTVLKLAPPSRSAHYGIAISLESWARHGSLEERGPLMARALPHYQKALEIDPKDVDSMLSIALIKGELGQIDEVLAQYEQVFAVDPELAKGHINRSFLLLSLGRLAEGWRDYEYRWEYDPNVKRLASDRPHWRRGEDLAGKTLLLYGEQGLGDCLQFVRYATVAARQGAIVWVRVPPPLMLLFASCPGVAQVFSIDEDIPPYDYLCPMLSVPGIVGTELDTIPADIPYLKAAPERIAYWRTKLELRHAVEGLRALPTLRVGLVWAGHSRKDMPEVALIDRLRSMHFDQIRPLLDVPRVEFHSLQVGHDTAVQLTDAPQVIDHSNDLFDFQETAALVENLDLAICVDTSTAHLVGAIGKPVWLLNRYHTCWRWLADRSDSPWYPTMRIFRQPEPGDWDSVIAEVRAALQIEANKAGRESISD